MVLLLRTYSGRLDLTRAGSVNGIAYIMPCYAMSCQTGQEQITPGQMDGGILYAYVQYVFVVGLGGGRTPTWLVANMYVCTEYDGVRSRRLLPFEKWIAILWGWCAV